MKIVRHIANLGYGSRRQVQALFGQGRVTDAAGAVLYTDDPVDHDAIRIDGQPLDPAPGLCVLLHKPIGTTCSTGTAAGWSTTCCRHAGACANRCCPPSGGWTATPAACCC